MYRRPWYWLVVLAVIGIAGTALVTLAARSRIAAIDGAFAASQHLRAQRIVHRVDAFFADAVQLVGAAAATTQAMPDDRSLERTMLRALFVARRDPAVYGLGVFFEPNAFDPHLRFGSIYVHTGRTPNSPFDHVSGDLDEVIYAANGAGSSYRALNWYRVAMRNPAHVEYDGPYTFVGRSFISILRAFRRDGRLAGVATVDTLTPLFRQMLETGLLPGDVAWVELPEPKATVFVSTGPPRRGANRSLVRVKLAYTATSLVLSSDDSALIAADRRSIVLAAVVIMTLWGLVGVIAVGLLQRWKAQAETRRLAREQTRLEQQVAVAKEVEIELRRAAYTDALTGLDNRAALLEELAALLARRPRAEPHALFFVDLDRFNVINETLGHLAGDELLVIVARRLRAYAPERALVARLGGDEFVVLMPSVATAAAARADEILNVIAEPALLHGQTLYPQASIGVVAIDEPYERPEDLLRDADIAVFAAKDRGRARAVVFDAAMRRRVAIEAELESELRRAVDRGEIVPYYQPIVDLRSNEIVAFEALARWPRLDGDVASGFVPFAERRGFARRIDAQILRSVCRSMTSLLTDFPDATVNVNVSAAELGMPGFDANLGALLDEYGVPAHRLKLEITETTMMTSATQATRVIDALRARGLSFVLDDFGTGYSSLGYLQRLPIAGVKIDRSFVEHLPHDVRAVEIVRSIVALAGTFGLFTTAEGIESAEQLRVVAELGVDYGQGFFFWPAMPLGELGSITTDDAAALSKGVE